MEEHQHPDLLDDEIDRDANAVDTSIKACRYCAGTKHLERIPGGFEISYCHWCRNYQ